MSSSNNIAALICCCLIPNQPTNTYFWNLHFFCAKRCIFEGCQDLCSAAAELFFYDPQKSAQAFQHLSKYTRVVNSPILCCCCCIFLFFYLQNDKSKNCSFAGLIQIHLHITSHPSFFLQVVPKEDGDDDKLHEKKQFYVQYSQKRSYIQK